MLTNQGRWSGVLLVAVLLLVCSGCARHLPVSAVAEQGGNIGVRIVTVTGEVVSGRLVSFDGEGIVVRVARRATGQESERRFPIKDVASATVHKTKNESTWGPVVSTVVGIAGGLLIAFAVRGAGS